MNRIWRNAAAVLALVVALAGAACVGEVEGYFKRWHLTTLYFDQKLKGNLTFVDFKQWYGEPKRLTQNPDSYEAEWQSAYMLVVMETTNNERLKCHCGYKYYRFTFRRSDNKAVAFSKSSEKLNSCPRFRYQKNPCRGCCDRP